MSRPVPAVSALMAVYNGEASLRSTVESVQAQSFTDWELLIIDDASTDSSVQLSEQLAAQDSRIHVLTSSQNSGGPAAPRNRGLAAARADVLCLIDQDDLWHARKLECQLRKLKSEDFGLVYSDALVERPGETTALYSELWGPMAEGDVTLDLLRGCFVPALTAAFPKSVASQIGMFKEDLAGVDDYDYWLRIALAGFRIGLVSEPLATWVVRPGSLSHRHVQQLERLRACLAGQQLHRPEEVSIVAGRLREIEAELRVAYRHESLARRVFPPVVKALRLARNAQDLREVVGVTRRVLKRPATKAALTHSTVTALTIAVVVPCYNYGRYLEGALESVLAQTLPADEVLVVNDGSLDDTERVAAKFASRVRCITTTNGGVSRARNIGLDAISSTHVVYLDADDRLEPNYLEACRAALVGRQSDLFAYTQSRGFGEHSVVTSIGDYSLSHLLRENFIHTTSMMPRDAVRAVRYDERLRDGLEDWELYLSLAGVGVTGVLAPDSMLLYRHHHEGVTANARRRPLRLARTKLRILVKHRGMYSLRGLVRQVAFVLAGLRFDAWERGSDISRRRIRKWRNR